MIPEKIIVATHATEIYGVPHALINFLIRKKKKLTSVFHPLKDNSKDSILEIYNGDSSRKISFNYPLLKISFLREFLINTYYVLKLNGKQDLFIGVDPLNASTGILLKKMGKVKKVIYYSVDYSPKRFQNVFLNKIYHLFDRFCAFNSDYVWNVTQRMSEVRRKQGVEDKKNMVVPNGHNLNLDKVKNQNNSDIVFVGSIEDNVLNGLKFLISSLPKISSNSGNEISLLIIGGGSGKEKLENFVKEKRLESYVKFLGIMDHQDVIKFLLKNGGIGMAPYTDCASHVFYGDSIKIKEYMACGMPIITTNKIEFSKKIVEGKAGFVYQEINELEEILIKLSENENFHFYSKNAISLSREYNWDKIFSDAFEVMGS